jgi:hypothetical protein
MATKYEVQEFNLFGGWANNWTYNDKPTIFDSYEAAQAELINFIDDCMDEMRDGNMTDAPDYNDFRIVEVQK